MPVVCGGVKRCAEEKKVILTRSIPIPPGFRSAVSIFAYRLKFAFIGT